MCTHQGDGHKQDPDVPQNDGEGAQSHDDDFSNFAAEDDISFTVAIGQEASWGGQQQVRQHKTGGPCHENITDLFRVDKILADANHQPAENVIVDGGQQLGQ